MWAGFRERNIIQHIRYGWAIVSFHSQQGRNAFLDDENRHFVRESKDDVWERLKVDHHRELESIQKKLSLLFMTNNSL